MDNINNIFQQNSKYTKLAGPLKAAQICEYARSLANGRFEVISFRGGLLTLGVDDPAAAANLQFESLKIIQEINQKLGEEIVQKIRFKTVQ